MSTHQFRLRAEFGYNGDDNQLQRLQPEIFTGDGWTALDLGVDSPGFLIFVYSFFICQHTFFHGNCTERGLLLDSADEILELVTGEDWKIERIDVSIHAELRGGSADTGTIASIEQRMRQCPVSINLDEPGDYTIELSFD